MPQRYTRVYSCDSYYRKRPVFLLVMRRQINVDCGRRYRRMLAEGEFTRRKTSHALGPSRNSACSKMLLSSLFFVAGCWLCLFSPFRTDHRKQLRSRSVATQQRLRTNSFAQLLGAPTPLIPHTYVLLWACNRHPSLRDQH